MRKHVLVFFFFQKMVRNTKNKKHNFFTLFLGWKTQIGKTKNRWWKVEKGELLEKEGERINNIFQDVCFWTLPSPLTKKEETRRRASTHKVANICKKDILSLKKGIQKKKLDKTDLYFLNQKRTQRQENCNFVWKSQRQRKQNNTHKEKKKEKQKKKREHSKKEKNKRHQPTEKMKKWQRNQKQSKNKICRRYKKIQRQRKHKETMSKPPKKGETQKMKRSKKYILKNQKKTRSMTTECTWDLTRPTTSRHAAMVNRAFNRARDPQRVRILKFVFFSSNGRFFFLKKIQMIIFGQFFSIKRCSSSQKKTNETKF